MIETIALAQRRDPILGKDPESMICPSCGAWIRVKMSGVVCSKGCGWWFCY